MVDSDLEININEIYENIDAGEIYENIDAGFENNI